LAGMTLAAAVTILAGCTTQPTKAPPSPPPPVTAGRSVDAPADADPQQKAFEHWVKDFRTSARAAGIDEATLNVAFADVRYLPRVVELDRAQPEFTRTVWSYLDSAVSPQRVALGQGNRPSNPPSES
jgi:membrane-bound lytic murein transglycosylase B